MIRINYIFGLERNGEVIDRTSIDDDDKDFAEELFYGEFKYKKQKGDKVVLIETYTDED